MRKTTVLGQLLAAVAAQQSGVHLTVLPSEPPMITTSDHYGCATQDIASYFLPPSPTGELGIAHSLHGDVIQTCTVDMVDVFSCPFPESSRWCGFSTAVPATLLDEYVAFGSTASSWWASRSATAVALARECPHTWWTARDRVTFGAHRLNITIVEAECYAEAHSIPSEPQPGGRMAEAAPETFVGTMTKASHESGASSIP